jgi:hypothetical protein
VVSQLCGFCRGAELPLSKKPPQASLLAVAGAQWSHCSLTQTREGVITNITYISAPSESKNEFPTISERLKFLNTQLQTLLLPRRPIDTCQTFVRDDLVLCLLE